MSDEMDEIWSLFADDGGQALEAMEQSLQALRDGDRGDQGSHVAGLFRAVHTFKGNSRVLGLSVIESRAHLAEDLIGLVRDRGAPLDQELLDILFFAMDTLSAMLEQVETHRADADPAESEDLMRQMQAKHDAMVQVLDGGATIEDDATVDLEALPDAGPDCGPEDVQSDAPAAPAPAAPEPVETVTVVEDVSSPAPQPEHRAEPQASGAPGMLADEGYRKIFSGMVDEAIDALNKRLNDAASTVFVGKLKGLSHAAKQMGLPHWVEALSQNDASAAADNEAIAAHLLALEALSAADLGSPAQVNADQTIALEEIGPLLNDLIRLGNQCRKGEKAEPSQLLELSQSLTAALSGADLHRAERAAKTLADVSNAEQMNHAVFALLQELVAYERVDGFPGGTSPKSIQEEWCAETAFDSLTEIVLALTALRVDTRSDPEFTRFSINMHRVAHACNHHKLESSARLTLSLLDIFSRVQMSESGVDPILLRIGRTYVDAMEMVFAAIARGEVPDTARIEALLGEAENATFTSSGVVSAQAVERRLNLPAAFHRVLSPESVRAATLALDSGKRFFITRADINDDVEMAERFMEWMSNDDVAMITNVTVFQDTRTLFDFLFATSLDQAEVVTQLATIDPEARKIEVTHALTDSGLPETDDGAVAESSAATDVGLSLEIVEAIGEASAAQATVYQTLNDLADTDLASDIRRALVAEGINDDALNRIISQVWQPFQEKLQSVVHGEALVAGQLTELQEKAVAQRSRPVSSVLRALDLFVQAAAKRKDQNIAFSSAGDDQRLDAGLLDSVRQILRLTLSQRFAEPGNLPSGIHVSVQSQQEHVSITIDETGVQSLSKASFLAVEADARRLGGEARQLELPGGGSRLHITLPRSMVVLEGMVVGVGSVRYVVPIEAVSRVVQVAEGTAMVISGQGRQRVLRLGSDEMAIIANLPGGKGEVVQGTAEGIHLIVNSKGRKYALPVDSLLGQQLVLLRPLRGVMAGLRHLSGVALLAGGDVGMVIAVSALSDLVETTKLRVVS